MAGRKAALALRVPKNTEELLAHAPCPEVLSTVILQWHVTTVDSIHGNKGDLVKVCWFQSENEEKHWLTQTQVLRIYSCQIQGQHDFECWCQIFGVQRQRAFCAHTLLAPSKFQTSGLAKCIGNGDVRQDDIISENIYSQDSQGNKNRLQRKAKANFGTRKHLLQLSSLQICQSSNRINDQLLLYLTVVSFLLNGPNSFQLLIAPLVADRCG